MHWNAGTTCCLLYTSIAVGLGRHLTAEAATRSALGAGARILKTYALELSTEDLREIERLHPDILLLSGGTNQDVYKRQIHERHQHVRRTHHLSDADETAKKAEKK